MDETHLENGVDAEILARFEALSALFDGLDLFVLIFLALALLEGLWDFWHRIRPGYAQTFTNVFITMVGIGLDGVIYATILLFALFTAEALTPLSIPITGWSWIPAVLVADFTYYWMHRIEHRIRVLWTYHSVHHSSPEFNLTTALRLSWLEGLVEWVFFVPMVLIGFDAVQALAAIVIVIAYQNWIHTEKIGRLGILEGILNTPSAHRVHHASDQSCLDRNFGGVLMIWDRIFGTYREEPASLTYGLTDPLTTANPLTINFKELRDLGKDMLKAGSPGAAVKYALNPPGWRARPKTRIDPTVS